MALQEIVFFDTETTIPERKGQSYELLEFAAIVVAAQGLYVLETYSTLIRPKTPLSITRRSTACNGITAESVACAPAFAEVADSIHTILNGRVWAGHNIAAFDIVRIKEAFSEIGREMPSCAGMIDTLPLLRKTFGYRAGNLKMATLAKYCRLGQQEHRSLADVQLNLEILKHCSTILFLETHFPTMFSTPQALITSPLTLRSSEEHVISQEEVRKAKVGKKRFVTHHIRAKGLQESGVLVGHDLSGREDASLSGIDNSKHAFLISEQAMYMKEKRVEFCSSSCSTIQKEDEHGAFDLTALSSAISKEALEEENGSNELQSSSSVYVATKNAPWTESSSKADSNTTPLRKHDCNLRPGYRPQFVEAVPSTLEKTSTPCSCSVGYPEGNMENVEANNMFQVEEQDLIFSGIRKDHDFLSFDAFGDDKSLAGFGPLCKASIETCYDIGESSKTLQANHAVANGSASSTESRQREIYSESFISACWISLEAIEVKEEPGPWKNPKLVFYHRDVPLRLKEINVKVRYSINASYAFDSNGKARFSIMIEPSAAACNVISKCEDLVRTFIANNGEDTTWRPTLINDGAVSGARLSIGTRGLGASATYTTEFYRHSASGLEKLVMDVVDADTVRNLIPRGSVIGVAFDLQGYSFNGYSGIRLLADHFLLR